ncbi:MAG TPA: hypothetical protein PLN99_10095, partial [Daejeonella sp.]|nr:hypothetical protein [Daejeonella sp.]
VRVGQVGDGGLVRRHRARYVVFKISCRVHVKLIKTAKFKLLLKLKIKLVNSFPHFVLHWII